MHPKSGRRSKLLGGFASAAAGSLLLVGAAFAQTPTPQPTPVPAASYGGRPLVAMLAPGASGDAGSTGSVLVRVNPGQGTLCYSLSLSGTGDVSTLSLVEVDSGDDVALLASGGSDDTACVTIDHDLARNMQRNVGDYALVVGTSDFPAGAVSGVLAIAAGDTTPIPTTTIPATDVPTTPIPTTTIPVTDVPPTPIPTTTIPATDLPPTAAPTHTPAATPGATATPEDDEIPGHNKPGESPYDHDYGYGNDFKAGTPNATESPDDIDNGRGNDFKQNDDYQNDHGSGGGGDNDDSNDNNENDADHDADDHNQGGSGRNGRSGGKGDK